MAIVKTYQVNGATVHVADDAYKNRSQEQINQSIKELSAITLSAYQQQAHKKSQVQ